MIHVTSAARDGAHRAPALYPSLVQGDGSAELDATAVASPPGDIETIYRALAPSVLGYLRGAGSSEPEDLVGDVFIAVVQGLPTFHGDERALRRWVFTIAHHRLVDERRRRAVRVADVEIDSGDLDLPSTRNDLDDLVDRMSARAAIDALHDLTPEQRDVVLLRSVIGLPIADTAAVLGKQQGAIKALHRRALAALARRVTPEAVR